MPTANKRSKQEQLPGKPESVWIATTRPTRYAPLHKDMAVDVAVLGGGIAGLTTAALLKEAGRTVAVVEARRIAEGVTGNTTAKVTSLHETIYQTLVKNFGKKNARLYGEANEAAIEWIARKVQREHLDCDFIRASAYTYALTTSEEKQVKEEYRAAKSLGLPASIGTETELPFRIRTAVSFANQAHFHPRKFLLPLAATIDGDGSRVLEGTTALDVDDSSPCVVRTDKGDIRAGSVIIATHQPFVLRGMFFARMHLKRSYALGILLRSGKVPRGMHIGVGPGFHSFRPQPYEGRDMLILGGESHPTGQEPDTEERILRLERYAREHFDVESIEYRWATQDNVTADRLPYIGRLSRFAKRLYIATGFGGWGMTNGTVAGMILADLILGRKNPWAALYDPSRLDAAAAPGLVKDNAIVAKEFVRGHLAAGPKKPEELLPGEGTLTQKGLRKIAVSRDAAGTLHAVSAVCTHLGCVVRWNNGEQTWDCPCHGSRFSRDGKVMQGPAVRDLPVVELKSKDGRKKRG